ncbi:MAG: hypothetical protein MK171_07460 [Pirellulales bacterium]|nr:hypothetical protein [Pirellulales bacterium]
MKIELLRTVQEVVHADSDPVRQALFRHLRNTGPVVKLVWHIHRYLGQSHLSTILIFLFAGKSYITLAPSAREPKRALIVAVHENARKRARKVSSWIGSESVAWLRLGSRQLLSPGTFARLLRVLGNFQKLPRFYRIVGRLNRDHDFLVACRSAIAVCCYVRAREILSRIEPSGVIVSSDSNPEPLAFARAATAVGIPSIFISHAYPTAVSPRLRYTLSVLDGEAALKSYEKKGPVSGRVIFCGGEGESKPMRVETLHKKRPTVGVFAPKVIVWPQFTRLIADCRRLFTPERILVRWHPSMLGPSKLASELGDMSGVIETDSGQLLQEVACQCDWIIADENSNVHLGVLKAGVPTVAMREFTVLPESRSDIYGFVVSRVIPPPVTSLSEVSMDGLAEFFSQDWAQRFRNYDAAYLNSPALLEEKAREEIQRVLTSNPSQSES